MQPHGLTLAEDQQGVRQPDRVDRFDIVDRAVASLSRGDITRREEILWGFTPEECGPFAEICEKEVRFQTAVLAFLGIEDDSPQSSKDRKGTRKNQAVGEYCQGSDVEECKRYFGDGVLPRICETCPD
jgi:hypothetical protein